MGRSVSYLNDATKVVYADVSLFDEDGIDWEGWIDNIRSVLSKKYPSMQYDDEWEDEVHIILSNQLVEVAVSEYCGLASISVRVNFGLDEREWGLARRFIGGVESAIEQFGDLRRVGGFSDGTSVYEPVK